METPATKPAAKTRAPSLEELVAHLESTQLRKDVSMVRPGMTVVVQSCIVEKGKVRTQAYEGMVIKVARGRKPGAAITVCRIASGVGVERTLRTRRPWRASRSKRGPCAPRQALLPAWSNWPGRSSRRKRRSADQGLT
ncbi:MAG: 50S ribosomal protein L19 [Candidatus Andersenbacteria bacterium]